MKLSEGKLSGLGIDRMGFVRWEVSEGELSVGSRGGGDCPGVVVRESLR